MEMCNATGEKGTKRDNFLNEGENYIWFLIEVEKKITEDEVCHTQTSSACPQQKSTASISKLTRGDNITTDVLWRICNELNCDFGDIMEFVPPKKEEAEKTE